MSYHRSVEFAMIDAPWMNGCFAKAALQHPTGQSKEGMGRFPPSAMVGFPSKKKKLASKKIGSSVARTPTFSRQTIENSSIMAISSEDAKNWTTVASIIIGGLWVLFQWNTLFPKTDAEVELGAAEVRARTSGAINIELIPTPDGVEPATLEGLAFTEACNQSPQGQVSLLTPVRLSLQLSSSAPIPVRVEATHFLLAEVLLQEPTISTNTTSPIFVPNSLGEVQSLSLTDSAFVGGLRWTNVEPQGEGILAVLGSVNLPFSCEYGASSWTPAEFALGLKVAIQAVERSGNLGQEIERYFYQVCKINADGGSTCSDRNAETEEAIGSSDFKVIAQ